MDELLTMDEAGARLGVTKMTVHRLVVDGILTRADDTRWKNRQVLRSSVERVALEWSRRLTIAAAAAMLGVGVDKVRELVRAGVLPRHRYGPGPIAIDDVQRLIDTDALTDPVHRGRVPLAVAAEKLGDDRARRLVRSGRIPAVKDARGHWWLRPEHIDQYINARATEQRNRQHQAEGGR
jgi:excisionase family DNA binding protein